MLSEPSIGICILTYNSSTTIPYTLHFLLRQDYPKDKIFYLVVDGGSSDNTVETVKNILSKHAINYQIIAVPHSNIPQARNICLDILAKKNVSYIIFVDSDILLVPTNILSEVIKVAKQHPYAIIGANRSLKSFKDEQSMYRYINSIVAKKMKINIKLQDLKPTLCSGMDFTVIPFELARKLQFNEKLNFREDRYYTIEAFKNGYITFTYKIPDGVIDVNIVKEAKSDLYWRLSVREYFSGIFAKSVVEMTHVLGCGEGLKYRNLFSFIVKHCGNFLFFLSPFLAVLAAIQYNILLSILFTFIRIISLLGYVTYKHIQGYPTKKAIQNRLKFELFSVLLLFLTPEAIPKAVRIHRLFKKHIAFTTSS